jgi:glycerol-3-phosphate dehydrogenase subunit B
MPTVDVAVIGAGLAGLSCAIELAERGARVFVAAKGMAATHWTHGGIDIAAPIGAATARDGLATLRAMPRHPYAFLADDVPAGLDRHLSRLASLDLPYRGGLDDPLVPIPTAIGTWRRASCLPLAQADALMPWSADEGLLLIGFARFRDAWPVFAAAILDRSQRSAPNAPREVRGIEVTVRGLADRHNVNALTVAQLFDDPAWRTDALAAIARAIPAGRWRVGLPAVLGLSMHGDALADARRAIGHPIIELPSLPPSVPGLRLWERLCERLRAAGGRLQFGFPVVRVEREAGRVAAIHTEGASRTLRIAADAFVLATGGIGGAGIRAGLDGRLEERVFGLPVEAPPPDAWFAADPLTAQPIDEAGIRVDEELRAVGGPANALVIGSSLAGMRYLDERCGDGVAIASAHLAARLLNGERPLSVRDEAVA